MRIRTASMKAGVIVGAVLLVPMIGVVLGVASPSLAYAWSLLAMAALVVFAARVFRGPDESSRPRPWWQATATPGASGVLALLFSIQAVIALFGSASTSFVLAGVAGASLLLIIAGMYLISAVKLSAKARTGGR